MLPKNPINRLILCIGLLVAVMGVISWTIGLLKD